MYFPAPAKGRTRLAIAAKSSLVVQFFSSCAFQLDGSTCVKISQRINSDVKGFFHKKTKIMWWTDVIMPQVKVG